MSDKKQIAIKERILKQAMEFWGVSDIRDMDPVIDLLLEVFAHESNKLHQEIDQSDSRILHRLSMGNVANLMPKITFMQRKTYLAKGIFKSL